MLKLSEFSRRVEYSDGSKLCRCSKSTPRSFNLIVSNDFNISQKKKARVFCENMPKRLPERRFDIHISNFKVLGEQNYWFSEKTRNTQNKAEVMNFLFVPL